MRHVTKLLLPGPVILAISIAGILVSRGTQPAKRPTPAPTGTVQAQKFQKMPLYFIENRGQLDSRVAYYVQGRDKTLYFTKEGLTLALTDRKRGNGAPKGKLEKASLRTGIGPESPASRYVVKLDFVGANPDVKISAEEKTAAVVSYFKGPRSDWKTGLPTFTRVVYSDLWPGIDLVYSGTVNRLKYSFVVKPGADPDRIQLAYRGATKVGVAKGGRLNVETPAGSFQDDEPNSYQDIEGCRISVETSYALSSRARNETRTYGFHVGAYDRTKPLVLDPAVLVYAGYIGGSSEDGGQGIAVDSFGNAYVTGSTGSTEADFPVTVGPDMTSNGGLDAFVAKINAAGTALVYAGYIGGSGFDQGYGIALDSSGNAYVTGLTYSTEATFPVNVGPDLTFNGLNDAFVAKVNPAGTGLVYCGYIGGNSGDEGYGLVVDGSGNAYVTGRTSSDQTTFPVTVGPDLIFNGFEDAFVAKVNFAGTALVYAGYVGGSGQDVGLGIALDNPSGSAYVTGFTGSTEATFPVTVGPDLTYNGGTRDAFVAKVNAAGTTLVYAGYIGGAGEDEAYGIAVYGGGPLASTGEAFVTGRTASTEATFPVIVGPDLTYNGGPFDAFAAKINSAGNALVYCGYIGGNGDDEGFGIALPLSFFGQNSAYVTGFTDSTEATFPVTGGPDVSYNGSIDAFVARVSDFGNALVYAGYVGGANVDEGFGVAVNTPAISSVVFFAYLTGLTNSTEATFPVTVGPDLIYNGAGDAFVAQVAEVFCPTISISPSTLPGGNTSFFYSQTLTASGGGAPYSFAVTSGSLPPGLSLSGSKFSLDEAFIDGRPTTLGTFAFTVTATDDGGCMGSRSYTITISQCLTLAPPTLPSGIVGAPYNQTITATGDGPPPYSFLVTSGSLPPGVALSTGGILSGTPTAAGSYPFTVTATNDGGDGDPCTGSQPYTITVTCPTITLSPPALPNGDVGTPYNQAITASGAAAPYGFTVTAGSLPPGVTLSSGGVLSGTPTTGGTYSFTVTATDFNQCIGSRSYTLTIAGCGALNISPSVLFEGFVGVAYRRALSGNGGAGPYSFSLTSGSLPPGLSLSGGVISGTPTAAGTYTFQVRAVDANGCAASRTYTLTISCRPATLSPPLLPSASQGAAYVQTLTVLGGPGPYTFSVTAGALPTGLTLLPSGAFSGAPADLGTFAFTVTATDANGCTGVQSYTLTVCTALTVSPAALPGAIVGVPYSQTIAVVGGTGPYVFAQTGLPAPLTLAPATGVLSGTPTAPGVFPVTVTVIDANGCSGVQSYILTVCPILALSPASLPDGVVGTAYSQTIVASNGTGPYHYTAAGLPSFLTLSDSSGVLSGTPAAAGTVTFTVTASDANGCAVSHAYTIRVTEAPPVITGLNLAPADGGNFGLSVTGSGFVAGSVVVVNGVSYPATFVSPTLVTVTLPASAIPTVGTVTVVVTNPGETGATSNPATLTFCTAPAAPVNPTIEPLGNPTGPITATDFLHVRWNPPPTEPTPAFYEFRINGDAWSAPVAGTSAVAPPRGINDPITLFVRAHCNAAVSSPAAASPTYSLAPPVADFTFSSARINSPVTFTDTSSPQATSWLWIFDDGGTSTVQSPTHTFTTAGTHRVALIASNGSGSSLKIKDVAVSASTSGSGAVTSSIRSFTTSDGWRWNLPQVAISGDRSTWLRLSAGEAETETIVYLRFVDAQGQLVLERRLSIAPGQSALNDITAYGLEGVYNLEIVASRKIVPVLAQQREVSEIERRSLDENP